MATEPKITEWTPDYKKETPIPLPEGMSSVDGGLANLNVKTITQAGQTSLVVTYVFYSHTIAAGTGQGIPKTIVVDRNCTILEVYLKVETAPGSAKTLLIDVNKNGTTVFTDQTKRPSITGTDLIGASSTPDITALVKNDELTLDIDTSDGTPAKLSVYVRCKQ